MDEYDTVFVGFPIWWYIAPTIINTFLESDAFSEKTIIPFAASGGSGMGNPNGHLVERCSNARLLHGKVFNADTNTPDFDTWIKELNR